MRGFCRILILVLVVAALPLRGVAALAADLCSAHHGGAALTHDGHDSSTASSCSLCASCSVGASLAAEPARRVAAAPAGTDRIPFSDTRKPGHVPDHPHRPPLVS